MTKNFLLAFIGGSGVYQIEELRNQKWIKVDTPWGAPSDKILTGTVDGRWRREEGKREERGGRRAAGDARKREDREGRREE